MKIVVTAALLLLSGCTLLYVPPVPARTEVQVTPRLTFNQTSELRWTGARLELSVTPTVIPEEGWLAVQWFSPQNQQVASDSVWLSNSDAFLGHLFLLPGGLEAVPGEWRVALSFGATWVRQFSAVVPGEK